MIRVIGVTVDGVVEWHAAGGAHDYDTLCGVDANDDVIGHTGTVTAPRGQKITCAQCYGNWRAVVELRLRDASFDPAAKR